MAKSMTSPCTFSEESASDPIEPSLVAWTTRQVTATGDSLDTY